MNKIKRYAGLLWMAIAPLTYVLMLQSAFKNINSTVKGDISNPVPWIIIIAVFTPIAIGLVVFGWYAFKGEYDKMEGDAVGSSK